MKPTQTIKDRLLRIGRELRYRPLPALIGRRITLTSLASVEPAIRALVSMYLAPDAQWQHPEHPEGALVKYGLIDAQLVAPMHLLGTPDTRRGVALFKELGFILSPEDRADLADMFGDGDQYFFERLIEDLDAQSCVLKLFLEDGIDFEVRMERLTATFPLLTLPADYFPRELTVTDACVTNSGFVWFDKHFYG